jgi:hypothetical protein
LNTKLLSSTLKNALLFYSAGVVVVKSEIAGLTPALNNDCLYKNDYILKTSSAIGCVVNFYYAGVVTRDSRIGSCIP